MKQVIVLREDLKLSLGKSIAQACHASLKSWQNTDSKMRREWESEGAKKVVVKVKTLDQMRELERKAKSLKISACLVRDAGHTEVEPGTITCLGIGPDTDERMDQVTASLALA